MGLTRTEFWVIMAIGVTVFLIGAGPVWREPFQLDGAIVWSYLVVVGLGLSVLAVRRRLTIKSAFLESTALLLVKFVITLSLAVGFWMIHDPPVLLRAEPKASTTVKTPRVTSVIADADRASIEGTIKGSDGAPVAGVVVYVATGLGAYVFAPTPTAVSMIHDGHGLAPRLAVVEVGQPLILETTDGQLHALGGKAESGEIALNLPVVARGRAKPFVPERELGLVALTCRVHEGAAEAGARLLVLGHPFHTVTDADGHFTLAAVPKGKIAVRGITENGEQAVVDVELEADRTHVDLTLAPPNRT